MKLITKRYNAISKYNIRRINIIGKNKSLIKSRYDKIKSREKINKEKEIIEDDDFSNINYNDLSEFEYRELITKRENYNDIIIKLEKSINEEKKLFKIQKNF